MRKIEVDKACLSFIVENLSLIIRLDADYNEWTSDTYSIQQHFCLALCKTMRLPADSLKIERVEEGSVILHIVIHPPYGQSVTKKISGRGKDNESSLTNVQNIQKFCAKFDSRVQSIVVGKCTLPIEKRLMDLKWDNINANISGSTDNICSFDSFDPEDKQSLCPEGSVNFVLSQIHIIIKQVGNDSVLKWPIVMLPSMLNGVHGILLITVPMVPMHHSF